MQTTGEPGLQSRLDIQIAQRTDAMARTYVNTHHKGQSENWIIELPVEPAMSSDDVKLAALMRVKEMLERDIALVKSAISTRQAEAQSQVCNRPSLIGLIAIVPPSLDYPMRQLADLPLL